MNYNKSLGRLLAIASIATVGVGLAHAHPRLVSASPAPNATVVASNRVVLNFSERLVAPLSGGELYMTHGGRPMRMGVRAAASGKTLTFTAPRRLSPGSYRLAWHVVSADTHRINGSLAFSVK